MSIELTVPALLGLLAVAALLGLLVFVSWRASRPHSADRKTALR